MDINSMCIVSHVTGYEAIASSMFLPGVVWIGSFACFGVAVDLRGKQMCQWRGTIRRGTLLKNAKGRLYYFLISPTF
jgi:hypothetical protein